MNEMSVPLSLTAEGTKWSAWRAVAESEPAVPPRNSGSLPSAKMNSWAILSLRPCAGSAPAVSVSPTRLHHKRRIGPPHGEGKRWPGRRDGTPAGASTPPAVDPGAGPVNFHARDEPARTHDHPGRPRHVAGASADGRGSARARPRHR